MASKAGAYGTLSTNDDNNAINTEPQVVDEERKKMVTKNMNFLTIMAAIGGFLFGYVSRSLSFIDMVLVLFYWLFFRINSFFNFDG